MTQDANQTEQPADQEQSPCYDAPWIIGFIDRSDVPEFIARFSNRMIEPGVVTSIDGELFGDGRFRVEVWKRKAVTHFSMIGVDKHHPFYDSVDEDQILAELESC